jgi:hypothetical protein
MSQYPVVTEEGIKAGVNYLLSGPGGLGQNFQGTSSYSVNYLTGNFRAPFSVPQSSTPNPPQWYIPPISISNAYPVNIQPDGTTKYFTCVFSTPQSYPPFNPGQTITVENVIDSDAAGFYDGTYSNPGVYSCTTTEVIIETRNYYTYPAYVSGGDVTLSLIGVLTSTDCNARVVVTGPGDQVFITAQSFLEISYTCSTYSELQYAVAINRYIGFVDTQNPEANDYLFNFSATVSERNYNLTVLSGSTGSVIVEPIFTTVIDQPSFGYYWYILEIEFVNTSGGYPLPGDLQITTVAEQIHSFTAQVIKQ